MKTYKDFDLSLYKTFWFQEGEKLGFEEEYLKHNFENFLDKAKDHLETKVHCLTCGVPFPLNHLEHDCQEEDIWLYRYVQNSFENKKIKKQWISKLKKKYPLRKGNRLAFRGINFQSKGEYEGFMEEVRSGTYCFQNISSWSLHYSYAKRFARCVQKGTRADDNARKQELRNMFQEKSNITGYKGVVLAIDLKKNMVLADISKECIGSMNEYEVIILPGTYPVVVAETIDKKYGEIEWDENIVQQAKQL